MNSIFKLKGVVQHYAWGGTGFLPQLLHLPNPTQQPFAEYWLGAHPKASAVVPERAASLAQLIAAQPEALLGNRVAKTFGDLPYLFKLLDVRQMLSIQVHPSKAEAEAGFAMEKAKGIPLEAPHRNYKDRNHKPELMAALSPFWLLHGFKPEAELQAVLNRVPEFRYLLPVFGQGDYRALYQHVMTLPQAEVDRVLSPLLNRLLPLYDRGELQKESEDFWAARAARTFCPTGSIDRGIFSVYFFNLVQLLEGEGIYQPAGLPHAYLEGQNVEVMAASDNVLRAGLTDKHVDVPALLQHVRFAPTHPQVLRPGGDGHQIFEAPVAEFQLERIRLSEAETVTPESAETWLVYKGTVEAVTGEVKLRLESGEAALLTPGNTVQLAPVQAPATLFVVRTPVHKI